MLRPYIKIWEWEWFFGHAVKAISTLGVWSPCLSPIYSLAQRSTEYFWKRTKHSLGLTIGERAWKFIAHEAAVLPPSLHKGRHYRRRAGQAAYATRRTVQDQRLLRKRTTTNPPLPDPSLLKLAHHLWTIAPGQDDGCTATHMTDCLLSPYSVSCQYLQLAAS